MHALAAAEQQEQPEQPTSISDLPQPLLEHVLGALACKRGVASARLVCGAWRAAITASCAPLPQLNLEGRSWRPDWLAAHAGRLEALRVSRLDSVVSLAELTRLSSLAILDSRRLEDLAPLTACSGLHRLALVSCREVMLEPLAQLPQLNDLLVDRCASARDLRPLSGCTALSALHLSFDVWVAMRLELPASLPALRVLRMLAAIQDLQPLGAFTGLTSLEVYAVSAHSLSALSRLVGLQDLTLHQLQDDLVEDHAALGALSRLSALALPGADPGVIQATPWPKLAPSLRRLDLHGAATTDLAPLSCLGETLEELSLERVRQLSSLSPLRGFTALRELNLVGSSVRDLRPVLHLLEAGRVRRA